MTGIMVRIVRKEKRAGNARFVKRRGNGKAQGGKALKSLENRRHNAILCRLLRLKMQILPENPSASHLTL